MKFDVIVGNPPFSVAGGNKSDIARTVSLYPLFYNKAIELASSVAMIMPRTDNKQMVQHETVLKNTAYNIQSIPFATSKRMGVQIEMWTVYHDKRIQSPPSISEMFLSSRKRGNNIDFRKGTVNLATVKAAVSDHPTNTATLCVYKALTKIGTEIVWVDPQGVKQLPPGKWAALIPLTIGNNGWSHTEVIQTDNVAVNINVTYVLADTKEQADYICNIVNSPNFIEQAHKVKGGGNAHVMTIAALRSIVC